MNTYHKEILNAIKSIKPTRDKESKKYHGNTHIHYLLSVPTVRIIVKDFVAKHADISFSEFIDLLNSLSTGVSYEEKSIVGKLIEYYPKLRPQIQPEHIDEWLNYLEGWAEIDSLCQSIFMAQDLLHNWTKWKKALVSFSQDKNVSKRRASLVLLTNAVSQTSDDDLIDVAFKNIETLKSEKNILISKAISWLLRSLVKMHKERVILYIEKNKESLPKIAVRETMTKIVYGKKTARKVKSPNFLL